MTTRAGNECYGKKHAVHSHATCHDAGIQSLIWSPEVLRKSLDQQDRTENFGNKSNDLE